MQPHRFISTSLLKEPDRSSQAVDDQCELESKRVLLCLDKYLQDFHQTSLAAAEEEHATATGLNPRTLMFRKAHGIEPEGASLKAGWKAGWELGWRAGWRVWGKRVW